MPDSAADVAVPSAVVHHAGAVFFLHQAVVVLSLPHDVAALSPHHVVAVLFLHHVLAALFLHHVVAALFLHHVVAALFLHRVVAPPDVVDVGSAVVRHHVASAAAIIAPAPQPFFFVRLPLADSVEAAPR